MERHAIPANRTWYDRSNGCQFNYEASSLTSGKFLMVGSGFVVGDIEAMRNLRSLPVNTVFVLRARVCTAENALSL